MLDSIYHMTNTLKSHFWRKNVIIWLLCTQRCYGRHNVSRKSINRFYCMALFHSQMRRHMINVFFKCCINSFPPGIFFMLFCHLLIFFSKTYFFDKKYFRNTIWVSNRLDPDQTWLFVGSDLGPICLQMLLADETSMQLVNCSLLAM